MPVPDFSPGEVLTAAAMDSIGLWLVKTVTIGNTVTSVPVTDCFSSNFTNYRVLVNTNISSAGFSLFLSLNGSTGATYSFNGNFMQYTSGTISPANSSASVGGFWLGVSGPHFCASVDIFRPFLASPTVCVGLSADSTYNNTMRSFDSNAASSVSATLTIGGGPTMTGGQIRVYGYRD